MTTTNIEIGAYLARLRDKAGLKQNELAGKVTWSPAVLSRVESGERALSSDELDAILDAIGTEDALGFKKTAERVWKHLPRPPLGHPDEGIPMESGAGSGNGQGARGKSRNQECDRQTVGSLSFGNQQRGETGSENRA